MKEITLFETADGTRFSTKEKALDYEAILNEVSQFLSDFAKDESDDTNFANGGGYIQHPVGTRDKMGKKLVELSNRWLKPEEPFISFTYYLGRILDDNSMKCLNHLSYRIMCIDREDKEWGQPYYANNQGTGKDKKLN